MSTFPKPADAAKSHFHGARPPSTPWPLRLRFAAAAARNMATGFPAWNAYRRAKPVTIVVLGMHRSGTSCIARMINLCGAWVGPQVVSANESNKAGHWEPLEAVIVNDALLRQSGGSWDNPPSSLVSDFRLQWKMRGFLGRLHRHGIAVFKDPRTVITYTLWKPMIEKPLTIAVFRHPLSVSRSLERRDGLELNRGIDLWSHYNNEILNHCETHPDVHWIDFDGGLDHVLGRVEGIAAAAGLALNPDAIHSYAPELRTSDESSSAMCDYPIAGALYERLRASCYASSHPRS